LASVKGPVETFHRVFEREPRRTTEPDESAEDGRRAAHRHWSRSLQCVAHATLDVIAASYWGPGDVIPLGRRTLRVIGKRDDHADQPPVLVVEDV
jgi:hypothetical protein